MATEVDVVAAGVENELKSEDFAAAKRLQQAGSDLFLVYYLPKIPAIGLGLPSMDDRIMDWRQHGEDILKVLGEKLHIPAEKRRLFYENLGPDQVFDFAKKVGADHLLTSNPDELSESPLSRAANAIVSAAFWIGYMIGLRKDYVTAKSLSAEDISDFVTSQLGEASSTAKVKTEEIAARKTETYGPVWSKHISSTPDVKKTSDETHEEEVTKTPGKK